MRNIKFRAWDKQAKKMIYSDEVYPKSMYKFEFDILNNFEFKLMKMIDRYNVTDDEGNDTYQEVFEVVEADIMQYTGLKDVEVNEIYEGDIVEYKAKSFTKIGQVKYGLYDEEYQVDMGFYIKWVNADGLRNDLGYWKGKGTKVIGNIFENPELLG